MAAAILREAIFATQVRALFINIPEWLNELREAMQNSDGSPPPSPRGHPLVVIDDLGAERASDWTRDRLYTVINHREANRLHTIVTTNLTEGELDLRLGRAIMSRLNKLCMPVEITSAVDFRTNTAERIPG